MSVKADLLYAPTHEWARIEGSEAVIGITFFAQEQLGDLTFVDLPAVGTVLAPGKEMGSVESVKAASDIYSPVAGEIIEVNTSLPDNPALLNTDPFGAGWIFKLKVADAASVGTLMDAAAYQQHIS